MPPSPPLSAGQMSELEQINFNISKTTDDSLESTRRMVKMGIESEAAGIQSLAMLDKQRKQLENAEKGLTKINEDIKETEKTLSRLQKSMFCYVCFECCDHCQLPCKKKSSKKDDKKVWENVDNCKVVDKQPQRKNEPQPHHKASGGLITRITNDKREEEMEQNMQQVSAIVGNLRNMALHLGAELDSQDPILDRLNSKADANEERIKNATKIARKLEA